MHNDFRIKIEHQYIISTDLVALRSYHKIKGCSEHAFDIIGYGVLRFDSKYFGKKKAGGEF